MNVFKTPNLMIPLISLGLIFIFIATFVYTETNKHQDLVEDAFIKSSLLTSIVEQRMLKSTEATNFILHLVEEKIHASSVNSFSHGSERWKWLSDIANKLPEPGTITFFNTQGKIIFSTYGNSVPANNYSDREYFKKHIEEGHEFHIGAIIKGRVSENYYYTISKRAYDTKGKLIGILLASIDVRGLSKIIESFSYYPQTTIAIYKGNADLVFRQEMNDKWLGLNIKESPLFSKLLLKSPKGRWEIVSYVDKIYRYYTYTSIKELDLVVMSGIARDQVFKNYKKEFRTNAILTLFSIALIILLNYVVLRFLKETKRADLLRAQITHNVSHELRNPMNTIIGFADLALETNNVQEVHGLVTRILKSSSTLLTIVNDILDYAACEHGNLKIKEAPFSLTAMLEDIEMGMKTRVKSKGVEFKVTSSPSIPKEVIGDSGRIMQVLNNLCSNAIKFTSKGQVELKVLEEKRFGNFLYLKFSVIDTGIGIDTNDLTKLFKPFSRIDSAIMNKERGTGLGLKISQDFINLMGGKIEVISTKGSGSEFFFTVPLKITT